MATMTRAGLVAALTLALTAGACVPWQDDDKTALPAESAPEVPGYESRSPLAAFAAGRMAHLRGDTGAAAEYYARALKYDPENVDLLQRAFTLLAAEGRFDEAAPLADRLLKFDADAAVALLVAGVREMRKGDFAAAEQRFSALPRRGVTSFLGPLATAWARAGEGRTDAALDSLAALGASGGTGVLHAFHAGLLNDLAGRVEAADENYRLTLAGQMSARIVEAAGSFYQRNGQIEQAGKLYARFHAEHPDLAVFDTAAFFAKGPQVPPAVASPSAGLAQALYDTGVIMRQSNALELASLFSRMALALEPDFPLAKIGLGEVLSSQGRLDEANAIYRSVQPGSPLHYFGRLRAAINADEAGDTEAALKDLSRLAQESPSTVDALVTKAQVLHNRKRYQEAADAYSQALARIGKAEPRHWNLFYARGIAFERSRQWPKAEADFKSALELRPDQPDVLNYLGYSWVDQGQHLEEARRMIERAVELRPNDGAIVDSYGWALYRLGEFQRAVSQLERAVELKPEDSTINDHLGDAYWQVGRLNEAAFQWSRALGLDPEPEQIDAIKAKIETGSPPTRPLAP